MTDEHALCVEQIDSTARDLLRLLFPDRYSPRWNITVTSSGITYCKGEHEKNELCDHVHLSILEYTGERYRHKKRGSVYDILAVGTLQVEPDIVLKDGDQMVVYIGKESSSTWVRETSEFHDGRFEKLSI